VCYKASVISKSSIKVAKPVASMISPEEANELSKKELIELIQAHGSQDFLKANKVAGKDTGKVAKRCKKDGLLKLYAQLLVEKGDTDNKEEEDAKSAEEQADKEEDDAKPVEEQADKEAPGEEEAPAPAPASETAAADPPPAPSSNGDGSGLELELERLKKENTALQATAAAATARAEAAEAALEKLQQEVKSQPATPGNETPGNETPPQATPGITTPLATPRDVLGAEDGAAGDLDAFSDDLGKLGRTLHEVLEMVRGGP
jgi:hypothetical protein